MIKPEEMAEGRYSFRRLPNSYIFVIKSPLRINYEEIIVLSSVIVYEVTYEANERRINFAKLTYFHFGISVLVREGRLASVCFRCFVRLFNTNITFDIGCGIVVAVSV